MKAKSPERFFAIAIFFIAPMLIGIRLGHTSIFVFFAMFCVMMLFVVIYLGFGLLSLFTKQAVGRDAVGMVCIFILICFVTTIVTWRWTVARKEAQSERIIAYVEAYKQEKGYYPKDLSSFPDHELCDYGADSTSFEVSFVRDGWHRTYYDSNNKEWLTRD